jgi:hypothetical protein
MFIKLQTEEASLSSALPLCLMGVLQTIEIKETLISMTVLMNITNSKRALSQKYIEDYIAFSLCYLYLDLSRYHSMLNSVQSIALLN